MKHTPGPWTTLRGANHIRIIDGNDLEVAYIDRPNSRDEANACLMAAAPDMLAALENLVDKYNSLQDGDIAAQLTPGDFFDARAAIAKARGKK